MLGLDVGPDVVYAAALRRVARGVAVDKTLALPAPDEASDDAFGQWLGEQLRPAGLANWPCVVVLPRRTAVMKTLTLPPGNAADRQRMAMFQAEKMLPFPVDSACVDFAPVHGSGDEMVLCAAKTEDVARWIRIAERAGLNVVGVKMNPLPYARAAAEAFPAEDGAPVAVAYLGGREAEIAIVANGAVVQDRGVALPPAQDAGDAAWRGKFMGELRRSLTAFAAHGRPVERLLLCGEGRRTASEASTVAFELNLDVSVVAAGRGRQLLQSLPRDEAAALPPESGAVRAAAAAAEAIAAPGHAIDLMRSRFQTAVDQEHAKRKRSRLVAALIAVVVLGLPWAGLWYRKGQLARLEAQAQALRPRATKLATMQRTLRFYASWREKRPDWLDVIGELSSESLMPYGIYIVSLNFKEVEDRKRGKTEFQMRLSGRTQDAKLVHDVLIPKLCASRWFDNVMLENVGPPADGKGRAFKLQASVVGFK